MKKLQKTELKKVLGGKNAPGPGCRCVSSTDLFTVCYTIAPPSTWISFCQAGKRYECLNLDCVNAV
jgi:hypothetical protein